MTTFLVNQVTKKSTYLVALAALIAVIFMDKLASISIIAGGAAGIVNFRVLARIAEKLLSGFMPGITIAFFSLIKVLITGVILFMLLQFKMVNIPLFLLGFTCVVLFILLEGARVMKGTADEDSFN